MQRGWLYYGSRYYYLRTSTDNSDHDAYGKAYGAEGAMLENGLWRIGGTWYWFWEDGTATEYSGFALGSSTDDSERSYIANNHIYLSRGFYQQNCYSFALDWGYGWEWPWNDHNPLVADAKTYLQGRGFTVYNMSTIPTIPYVIAYAKNGYVTHFARVTSRGSVYAKWGHYEIFRHTSINPYTNNVYGSASFIIK
jgi:hypothetical protein